MKKQKDIDTYYQTIARDSDYNGIPRCVNCGAVADDVHEIIPRSFLYGEVNEDELFDIKNRCCLCRTCHERLHNRNGKVTLMLILTKRHGYAYEGYAKCLLEEQGKTE